MSLPLEIINNLPKFPDFENISLENCNTMDWFFANFPPDISEYTFTNLYVWRLERPIKISLLENQLCILAEKSDGKLFFMPSVGEGDICKSTEILFSYLADKGYEPALYRVPEDMANALKECNFSVEFDPNNSDYVYLVEELATLSGRKFDGKRNRIKKCITEYKPEYKSMTPDILEMCKQLQTEWCDIRQCKINPGLESENIAINEILELMDKLSVFGGAIIINGKIEAFTIAERLNKNTAVIHFEKANPEIDGLYQFINQRFCESALKDFIYVNREQDLGIEGLRRAKQSYYPHHLINKYIVRSRRYKWHSL